MKKKTDWSDVLFFALCLFVMGVLLSGCSHNIHVKGWGFASPYAALGCGSFACVKDNTTVESTEKTQQMESKTVFSVGDQTTGYDVKMKRVEP